MTDSNPDAGLTQTLDRLLLQYREGGPPRFADADEHAAFVRQFEIALVHQDSFEGHLDRLAAGLAAGTRVEEVFDSDDEAERFAKEGLAWLPPERLAFLALAPGAVIALRELVFEVQSDYWYRVSVEAEKQRGRWVEPAVRLERLKARLAQASSEVAVRPPATPAAEVAMAFGSGAHPVAGSFPVPASQAIWLAHEPRAISAKLNWVRLPDDSRPELEVKLPELPVMSTATGTAWLADAGGAVIARATTEKIVLKFAPPTGSSPRFLFGEYRSGTADVFYAVALDGRPIDSDTFARLKAAAVAELAATDPTRSAALAATK